MLFTPLPLSQTVTPSRGGRGPLERDVLYGGPHTCIIYKLFITSFLIGQAYTNLKSPKYAHSHIYICNIYINICK